MKLHDLLQALPFYQIMNDDNPEITALEQDHRKVQTGSLFFCIKGANFDGHDFAKQAVEKGAKAIVSSHPLDVSVPVIIVRNTVRAMAMMADRFYRHPSHSLTLIGVTGTNGKTSVTHMINHIFQTVHKKTGLIGTLYTKIGDTVLETKNTTPDSLTLQKHFYEMKKKDVEIVTMEVSSHALDMGRVWGIDFDIAVFTNLTQDHLDYHHTMEEYRRVKSLLFSQLGNHYDGEKRKFAILNKDDDASNIFEKSTAAHVLTYGIYQEDVDVKAENITYTTKGLTYDVITPVGKSKVTMHVIGQFNVYNSLAAIATSIAYGLPLNEIVRALKTFPGVPGRFELVDENQSFTVIVDYAHTPDSLENVLKTIQNFAEGRIFVVVGCGGDRDPKKRPLMAQIACHYGTDPIFTSDNPRSEDPLKILADMEEGVRGLRYTVIPDRSEAIDYAISKAQKGDVVLIAGKGHETYQIIGEKIIDFDDRLIARECIKKLQTKN